MTTVLHPKGNRITVLRDPPKTKTEAGLELGNATVNDHEVGTVMEVGPGILLQHASMVNSQVQAILDGKELEAALRPIQVNDRVLYSIYAGMQLTVGGKNICILEHGVDRSEIIGVLEGEGE